MTINSKPIYTTAEINNFLIAGSGITTNYNNSSGQWEIVKGYLEFTVGPVGTSASYTGSHGLQNALLTASALIDNGVLSGATVAILPGEYSVSGSYLDPGLASGLAFFNIANKISIRSLGGLGSVTVNGNMVLTGSDGIQTIEGILWNGSVGGINLISSVSSVLFIKDSFIIASSSGLPAVFTFASGSWDFNFYNSTFDATNTNSDAVGIDTDYINNVNAFNCEFNAVGSNNSILIRGELNTKNCVMKAPLKLFGSSIYSWSSQATLTNTTFQFINPPLNAISTENVLSSSYVRLEGYISFKNNNSEYTGSLATSAVTMSAYPGVFLGAYTDDKLPTITSNGVLAYNTSTDKLYMVHAGSWAKV